MDPKYQVEPTFETTLTDVSELRRRFATQDEGDWPRYKMIVINSIRSGVNLAQRVTNAEAQIEYHLARKGTVDALAKEVEDLKKTAAGRKSFIKRWAGRLWYLGMTVFTVLVTRWLSK